MIQKVLPSLKVWQLWCYYFFWLAWRLWLQLKLNEMWDGYLSMKFNLSYMPEWNLQVRHCKERLQHWSGGLLHFNLFPTLAVPWCQEIGGILPPNQSAQENRYCVYIWSWVRCGMKGYPWSIIFCQRLKSPSQTLELSFSSIGHFVGSWSLWFSIDFLYIISIFLFTCGVCSEVAIDLYKEYLISFHRGPSSF